MSRYPILLGTTLLVALLAGAGLTACSSGTSPDAHSHGEDDARQEGEQHADAQPPEGVVQLTPAQIEASGIGVVGVGRGGGASARLSGRVEPSIGAHAAVASAVAGRVERVLVAPGTPVKAGQVLAVVVSGEAASLRASAVAADAQAQAARLAYGRDKALVEQGVVARQELEASRARSVAADAAATAARAQASASGAPDNAGRIRITSPMAGVVGSVQVTPGGVVAAGTPVADVSDPAMRELVFTAPPALAAQVSPGMRLEVTGPSGAFQATVAGVAADVHAQGGAAIIRAKGMGDALPPSGSPVSALVVTGATTPATTQTTTLTAAQGTAETAPQPFDVPADAVQQVDGRSVVFVATADGFRATPVMPGRRAGDRIEIVSGLDGSERIVGTNAFLLKAELAKGEAEHGH